MAAADAAGQGAMRQGVVGAGPTGSTGWAILGAGAVAAKFALGLRALGPAARVVAVASRRAENAGRLAAALGTRAADGYEAAVAAAGVDAVYVATPPSEHERHARLAIDAGRAVLVEKPFATDAAAARRIAAAAAAAGVFVMEAMWTRFLPVLDELRARLAAGAIGEVRALEGSFMATDRPDEGASLFDPARGGGALLHRGIYPLSLARHLLGPVDEVRAMGRRGATGVDEDCTVALRHASGAVSTIRASLRAPGRNDLLISGTRGTLRLNAPVFRPWRLAHLPAEPRGAARPALGRLGRLREGGPAQALNRFLARDGGGRVTSRPYAGNGYQYEAAEVMRCLARGEVASPLMPPAESVEIMALVDAALAQV